MNESSRGPDPLMDIARQVRERMQVTEAALGLVFPLHVRFLAALEMIEEGVDERDWLEVAVGFMMLREIEHEVRAEQVSQN